MVGRLTTIGVYGFTAERFVTALEHSRVDVLLDVRERRGVRGAEYAWANSRRLQAMLAETGIAYRHLRELAPSADMRAAQHAADACTGKRQRTRTELADAFKSAYATRV